MENLSVKQLKVLAKNKGITQYYKLRIAELIEALAPQNQTPLNNTNILDEPITEINIPIMKPTQPIRNCRITLLKDLASKAADSVNNKINEFSDWVLSYVPEPIQKTVNERVENLKEKINKNF